MDFSNKSVLVVGAARGIGKAAALAFGAHGARVAVADLNYDGASDIAELISAQGDGATAPFACDVTDYESCLRLVEEVLAAHGRLDVLVNAVGWTDISPFMDESQEYWRRVVDINLLAPMFLCHAALRPMQVQNSGSIVLTSSDAAKVGTKGETAYAAAKAGVIGFVKSLARETARYNIRVNGIAPGPTDTPLLREQIELLKERGSLSFVDSMIKAVPMRRLGLPEEQANGILFLASDRSSYVTGQTLSISGGLTMNS